MVDFKALVLGVKKAVFPPGAPAGNAVHDVQSLTNNRSDLDVVYLASLRSEDGEEDFSCIGVLRIWGGLDVSF